MVRTRPRRGLVALASRTQQKRAPFRDTTNPAGRRNVADITPHAGLLDVRLHDLRRTLRTGLAELGVNFEVAERVLNHAMPGLQAVYNRHNYMAEKRAALTLWAEHVLALAEKREPTVVAFRSTAA